MPQDKIQMKCYITDEECEFAEPDGHGSNECVAIWEEQCPIWQKEQRPGNEQGS